eukprot:scaffold18372_cov118-Isochrysis_galbana.AAC.2
MPSAKGIRLLEFPGGRSPDTRCLRSELQRLEPVLKSPPRLLGPKSRPQNDKVLLTDIAAAHGQRARAAHSRVAHEPEVGFRSHLLPQPLLVLLHLIAQHANPNLDAPFHRKERNPLAIVRRERPPHFKGSDRALGLSRRLACRRSGVVDLAQGAIAAQPGCFLGRGGSLHGEPCGENEAGRGQNGLAAHVRVLEQRAHRDHGRVIPRELVGMAST